MIFDVDVHVCFLLLKADERGEPISSRANSFRMHARHLGEENIKHQNSEGNFLAYAFHSCSLPRQHKEGRKDLNLHPPE